MENETDDFKILRILRCEHEWSNTKRKNIFWKKKVDLYCDKCGATAKEIADIQKKYDQDA